MFQRHVLALGCIALLSPLNARAQNVELVATIPNAAGPNIPPVFLEGPTADRDGDIYFTDMVNDEIHKLGTDGKISSFRRPANHAAGLVFDSQFRLIASEMGDAAKKLPGKVTRTDLTTGRVEVLIDQFEGKPLGGANDLTIDSQGRIYFTVGFTDVFRIDTDGRITRIAAPPLVRGSNGIMISPDDKVLYLVEQNRDANLPRRVRAFDLNRDGSVSNARVFHDFYPGRGGDGMAIDVQGNLYVAAGMNALRGSSETLDNKAGIYVFSPAGALLRMVPIPMDTLTNLCFGGPDMKTVYVTAGNKLFKFRNETAGTRR